MQAQILIWVSLVSYSFSELQKRVSLISKQLQDSELRLKDADAKNFNLSMKISYWLMFHVMLFPLSTK